MNRLTPRVLSIFFLLVSASCGDDSGVDNGGGNGGGGADSGVPSNTVEVSSDIDADTTWTADNVYRLKSNVFVRDAALTIEAGTVVVGESNTSLVITSSATIEANGTADAPVVFTSSQPEGARAAGDWGGLVLLGKAPINIAGGSDSIEGFPAGTVGTEYGGGDDAHDCGTLRYARIEFAGFELSADNELNGLTVGACGSATEIDYVQVHKGADDGIEFFGGSAPLRHALITQTDDDGLDWDLGWKGDVQWLIVQQNAIVGNYGFESDNNANDNNASPRSAPTIWNATLIGSGAAPGEAGKLQIGMLLRRGTAASVHNAVIAHFADAAIDIADFATVEQARNGELVVENSFFYKNGGEENGGWPEGFDVEDGQENDCETPSAGCAGFDEAAFFMGASTGNAFADPMLKAPLDLAAPDFSPAADSPVLGGGGTPGEGFDASATYAGAVGESDWTAGWTAFPSN